MPYPVTAGCHGTNRPAAVSCTSKCLPMGVVQAGRPSHTPVLLGELVPNLACAQPRPYRQHLYSHCTSVPIKSFVFIQLLPLHSILSNFHSSSAAHVVCCQDHLLCLVLPLLGDLQQPHRLHHAGPCVCALLSPLQARHKYTLQQCVHHQQAQQRLLGTNIQVGGMAG